jgi:hypothetical protein
MEDDLQWKTTSNGRQTPMEDNLQWKTTSNGRQPPMEDNLHCKTTSNGRQPPMEDNLQWKTTSNGRQPPMEDNLHCKTTSNGRQPRIVKVEYLSYHCMYHIVRGKLEESSEEIWSVALLSLACIPFLFPRCNSVQDITKKVTRSPN